jgi:hypothetical protein
LNEAAAASLATPAAPAAAVAALLSLQEVADASQGNPTGLRFGHDLLDRLEALRLAMLDGRIARPALAQLASLLAARRGQVRDPGLAQVLAEIELRAAVELAKLEQNGPAEWRGPT